MAYDPAFIQGADVQLPSLGDSTLQSAFNDGNPIDHSRFSILFNSERGFAAYTAHNIDGASVIPEGEIPRVDRFRNDPDVPSDIQVNNERGYANNPWDRGHLVRRRALHWGDRERAELADRESYFWTNIAPQHSRLNRTAWGNIEDWMLQLADQSDQRACVFTGPVFTGDDPSHINPPGEIPVLIPSGFWKILTIRHQGHFRAAGFLVWQRDFDRPTPVAFDPLLEQVRITTIEYLSGLSFGDLRNADPLRFGVQLVRRREFLTPSPGTADTRPAVITSVRDIMI